ncbi:unnamed protein product [Kuraishia capsulata CBS 1993]|uniref:2-dehydropantolactone reductase n=1 Tax=Kuraishia capsulata CBS 1993 TaxID=1382522 RepID=W6MIM8_9ASCO|nr:uncharacterized protein KUCA_T00002310001 [Kuraishia capsulata CBS 1993]CDK26339.1 unnamed protein product [Kuraishia capsulata CBS 1993]
MKATEVDFTLNDGNKIPAVGLGTACPPEDQEHFIDSIVTALRSGVRHIDSAWYYGSEPMIGVALQRAFAEGIVKREDIFITTKVWPGRHDDALGSLNESLELLQLDYVDLFLQHLPLCYVRDTFTIVENADHLDTWKEMIQIYKTTTKAKSIGVCNYSIPFLERLFKETDVVPVVNQVELHPRLPQLELVKFCRDHGILVEAYSPLGAGGAPLIKLPIVNELADKYKVTAADILVSFHVCKGNVVLARTQNLERLKQGWEFVKISSEDLAKLDDYGIANHYRYIAGNFGNNLGFPDWNDSVDCHTGV